MPFSLKKEEEKYVVTHQIQNLRQRETEFDVDRVASVEDGSDGVLVVADEILHQSLLAGEELWLLPVFPVAVVDW